MKATAHYTIIHEPTPDLSELWDFAVERTQNDYGRGCMIASLSIYAARETARADPVAYYVADDKALETLNKSLPGFTARATRLPCPPPHPGAVTNELHAIAAAWERAAKEKP